MPLPASEPVRALMAGDTSDARAELADLLASPITPALTPLILTRWSHLAERLAEAHSRLFVQTTTHTADADAQARYAHFRRVVSPPIEQAEHDLKVRLLAEGACPPGFEIQWRRLENEVHLFREENQEIEADVAQLGLRFNQVTGGRTVLWDGGETTTTQLKPVFLEADRGRREDAWRLAQHCAREGRPEVDAIWRECLGRRRRLAQNAGCSDFRAYRWRQLCRFDYTPDDAQAFHEAIARVVVPLTREVAAFRRRRLGLTSLRPWDLDVDPLGEAPLRPFSGVGQLVERAGAVFHRLDPILGGYFDVLRDEGLLDLENRRDKAPIGYCLRFPESGRPFIFTNAVGVQRDVQTLFHESGHAFHCFESRRLPWVFSRQVGPEFGEVASMAMEFLAQDVAGAPDIGFYDPVEAARAIAQHLENRLLLWPKVAATDAFQHWAYLHPDDAMDPRACDAAWLRLSRRYYPDVDWTGLEPYEAMGWQATPHVFNAPFYYVEYGMALLGSVQIWAASLEDRAGALGRYRAALALGGSASLPQLFQAAGARFDLGEGALADAAGLLLDALRARWTEVGGG